MYMYIYMYYIYKTVTFYNKVPSVNPLTNININLC